jgi:septum formation protein
VGVAGATGASPAASWAWLLAHLGMAALSAPDDAAGLRRWLLASASPARLATLRAAGLDPVVAVSGVDEDQVTGAPGETALALARLKAEAVHAAHPGTQALVLGCDSVLDVDGVAHGKPGDAASALARWRELAGRQGVLRTGHWLIDASSGRAAGAVASTTVWFARPSADELAAYVATGEPSEVAGGFTLDGLGGWFVDRIDGDAGTVIGVSLPTVRRLLGEVGVPLTAAWPTRRSPHRPGA